MSLDIIVLAPNGRRLKVHCAPDTSILQVLENVCHKNGFEPSSYNLKYHNTILDLTNTIRFSNIPNKATLEMIETEETRLETSVTVGLVLNNGDRRTAEFAPSTPLYDLVMLLAPDEFQTLTQPTILYMRQEVIGHSALKERTLRHLGLLGGRAILRLLNKAKEPMQANKSVIYRTPMTQKENEVNPGNSISNPKSLSEPGPSANPEYSYQPALTTEPGSSTEPDSLTDPSSITEPGFSNIKDVLKYPLQLVQEKLQDYAQIESTEHRVEAKSNAVEHIDHDPAVQLEQLISENSSTTLIEARQHLERRLNIENEVTFIGTKKAIAYMLPEGEEIEIEDLPDDFYELSIEEVRKLYHDLQERRVQLENTPLVTLEKKKQLEQEASQQLLTMYQHAVVRIQFPDHSILQGVFTPTDTIEDITNFVKEYLETPDEPFHLFTTPVKENLDSKKTLLEARFVPCVHMHFKWQRKPKTNKYLKSKIYSRMTSSDAAGILASKYRAPSRRKNTNNAQCSSSSKPKSGKVPKWFKS